MGIETTYYEPSIGEGIRDLIRPNTKILFTESPGSYTMEVQDVPTLSRIAHEHDIIVMLDNTWGAGVNFSPFDHGVDVSIQAATKYIVGHSDVMLGTAVANENTGHSYVSKATYLVSVYHQMMPTPGCVVCVL